MISKVMALALLGTLTLSRHESRWDDDWTRDHEGEIVHWEEEDEPEAD